MSKPLRLNARFLPALVGLLLVLQLLNPSEVWKTLLVFLGGAWLVGYLWARGLARGLRLKREQRYGWAQVGDELEERFTIENTGLFPATWVELEDFSTLPGYQASLATLVGATGATELTTRGQCSRRGLYLLGGARLKSGDPLGIYTVSLEYPASQTLLVLPPVIPLPSLELTPGGFSGEGRPRTHSPEQTVGAAGVREYQPGDALRLIHWPTTARHGKPFIRLLDGAPASAWWLLLDLEAAAQVGSGWDSTEEHAIVLAASLADRALRQRKAVGLALNGATADWLSPREGEGQRWQILRSLALASPGALGLKAFLERSRQTFRQRSSLVVLTSNLSADWVEALAPFRWRGIVPTVLLVDPASFGGADQAAGLSARLAQLGIDCHLITRDLLDRPEAHPGQRGRWAWRVSVTGKVVPVQQPADSDWRSLG